MDTPETALAGISGKLTFIKTSASHFSLSNFFIVRGRVISRFGAKGRGLHNDGVNVAAPRGTPVLAAQSGVVAYAGNQLRGFGNLVLIRHSNGLMTAYAHNERLLVAPGDTVRRGQRIAKVGSTGSVASPQLHFEVRNGRQPVDPVKFLRRNAAT